MVESFMRYLISVGPIEYPAVESFMRYLIEVGLIKYLKIEFFGEILMRYLILNQYLV